LQKSEKEENPASYPPGIYKGRHQAEAGGRCGFERFDYSFSYGILNADYVYVKIKPGALKFALIACQKEDGYYFYGPLQSD
jgi:hypothetical protein